MSQENAEAVRAVYSAWSDGDLDALLAVCDPGVVLLTSGAFPDLAPVYSGHDGMRTFWESMRVPWESFQLDLERIIEFGIADGPTPGTWTGIAAMGEAWRETLGGFDSLEMDVEECTSIDSERVLVLTTNTGRGKTSGFDLGEIRTRGANIFHIRDGKVTKLIAYWDRDRALEAVGLAE